MASPRKRRAAKLAILKARQAEEAKEVEVEEESTDIVEAVEDVVEEVVGEIQDLFDKEEPSIKILEDNSIIADGSISIYDLYFLIPIHCMILLILLHK